MILMFAVIAAAASGPILKFDQRPPIAEYNSAAKLEDIERCLITMDAGAPPNVYRQSDRPDDAMLVWFKIGDTYGVTGARLDLHRTASGTHVRSWMPAKQALDCAPKAG